MEFVQLMQAEALAAKTGVTPRAGSGGGFFRDDGDDSRSTSGLQVYRGTKAGLDPSDAIVVTLNAVKRLRYPARKVCQAVPLPSLQPLH